jgi:hypothetical protein
LVKAIYDYNNNIIILSEFPYPFNEAIETELAKTA